MERCQYVHAASVRVREQARKWYLTRYWGTSVKTGAEQMPTLLFCAPSTSMRSTLWDSTTSLVFDTTVTEATCIPAQTRKADTSVFSLEIVEHILQHFHDVCRKSQPGSCNRESAGGTAMGGCMHTNLLRCPPVGSVDLCHFYMFCAMQLISCLHMSAAQGPHMVWW